MKYLIKQTSEKNCGITCVKILSALLHHDDSYLFDLEESNCSSMLDLKKELLKRNIESDGYYIDDLEKLKKCRNSILLIKENSINHFVILLKLTKKYAYLIDPKLGKRIINLDYFKTIFTNNALVVKKINKQKKKKRDNYYMYKVTYLLSFLIDFSLIYVLTYIINIKGQLLYTLLVFISILLNLAFKFFIALSFSSNFEKTLILPLFNKDLDAKDLNTAIEYKAKLIDYIFKNLAYYCIIIFVILLLLKNSLVNFLSIIFCFMHPLCQIKFEDLQKILESNLFYNLQVNSKFNLKQYSNLKKKSSKFVTIFTIEKIGFWIIILLISIFINYFNNYTSLVFISINFFLSLSLGNLILNIYENENNKKEKLNEAKLVFLRISNKKKE